MAKRELKLNKEETKVEEVEAPKKEKVFGTVINCSKLRIRKSPSAKAEILGELNKGEKIEILDDKSADFYKIKGGYCMKEFVKIL